MSLTTGALATLRGPAPSREKYPEWTVTRTERLPPSRKCKPELQTDVLISTLATSAESVARAFSSSFFLQQPFFLQQQ